MLTVEFRTAENFRQLCTGEHRYVPLPPRSTFVDLGYQDSAIRDLWERDVGRGVGGGGVGLWLIL